MRKIWIDGYEANVAQRVGSGQVGVQLLRWLQRIDDQNEYTVVLPTAPLNDLPSEKPNWKYKILHPNKLWTWIALPLAIRLARPKPEVVFSPTHYIPRVGGVKRVVMIFDLAFIDFPHFFLSRDLYKLKNWTKYSILNADHIVTISRSTKKDIIKNYKIDPQKITVAYPGFDEEVFKPIKDQDRVKDVLDKYKISGRYVIYVGTVQPRKNLIRLMDAIKKIDDIKLVVVGKTKGQGREGWMFEETINYPDKLGIKDRVIFTGFVPTEEVPFLLSGAQCYVLPSLYEGFGIPLVEAMATGTPVVSSKVSSLPEVVGDAGLLVNPESVDEIEQAIRLVVSDDKKRQVMVKRGLVQASKFSWKKMAIDIKRVLDTV